MNEVKNKLDYNIILVNKPMNNEVININKLKNITNDDYLKLDIPNNCSYHRILNIFNKHVLHVRNADLLYYDRYHEEFKPIEEVKLKHIYKDLITNYIKTINFLKMNKLKKLKKFFIKFD